MKKYINLGLILILAMNIHLLFGQSPVCINEFQASNYTTLSDIDFNGFTDWIELYNPNPESVNLGGYFVTDDFLEPDRWQIPPNTYISGNGYLLIWCDNQDIVLSDLHTNFKLNRGGEEIGLYNQSLVLVDSIVFIEQVQDVSYGRKPDGNIVWNYFEEPTPLAANLSAGFSSNEQAPDVELSIPAGFFPSSINLGMTVTGSNVEIRYTQDGSQPTLNSELYSSSFYVDSSIVIKARAFQPNILAGKVVSGSYFIGEETELPVVSLIMNPQFLWDPDLGIYVDEDIQSRKDWEREGTIEYFNKDHELDFSIDANLRLFGNTAIYYPQKSLAVLMDSPLDYQLFKSIETDKFYSFIFRSSSDDWPYTMIRDALMHTLVKDQLTVDFQAYSPSVLFINGDYFGIHNIREKLNERYLETYHNIDQNNVDIIQIDIRDTTFNVLEGDMGDLDTMLDFVQNNDLSINDNYDQVKNMIDMDNYIDYLVANLFYSNTSWHHNVKIWKEKISGARWQWWHYDLDRGMTQYYINLYSVIEDLDTTDLFFPHLNMNEEFQHQLLNRMSVYMSTTFQGERVNHIIDSLTNKIENEIPFHSLRWKDECDPQGYCGIQSLEEWIADINSLKAYTGLAQEKVRQYISDFYSLEGTAKLTLNIENYELGSVYINGIRLAESKTEITFFRGVPITLVAIPEDGYLFLGWKDYSMNDTLLLIMEDDLTVDALFGSFCLLPEIIDEELILNDECDAYLSQGPITITPEGSLIVEEGRHIILTPGDSVFVQGEFIVNGSSDSPVYIRSIDDDNYWGCIRMLEGSTDLNFTEFHNYKSAISTNGGNLIVRNCTIHQSPFYYGDIFSIHHSNTTLENNLIFGPTVLGKTDVIDCDDITYGVIKYNTIFGATDDGIDIGTSSVNIEVSGNQIFDCNSMGISIGENSIADVDENIVSGCEAGIQVHTGSTANIDHNTLFDNEVSIRCYHYPDQPNSGGHAIVTNTILSSSNLAVYELFASSSISFAYSLSDTDPIEGEGNLNTDPIFLDPVNKDFSLHEDSPCIDAGDPEFPADPDGTRSDMGAVYFDHSSAVFDNFQNLAVACYPNPAVQYVYFYLTDTSETIQSLEFIDQQGRSVWKKDNVNDTFLRIDLLPGMQGIYYASILTSNDHRYNCKFIALSEKTK